MNIEELKKLIDIEIQWLYYYSLAESRRRLNEHSNIYNDLVSIGYTKRVMKLDLRCCPCIITSDEIISEKTDISRLKKVNGLRGENRLSPVEAYISIYPEKKMDIINRLRPK